jgi:preprotein translocase subunit SecE
VSRGLGADGESDVEQFRRLKKFLTEVWSELKKTTWPGRQEVYGTTFVVIVTVLICAFYLWVVDLILNRGAAVLFRTLGK